MASKGKGRLAGKVAIITGGGSGIGQATATLFASEGAAVVCADIKKAGAEETAGKVIEAGGKGIALKVDVSSPADAERMASETIKAFGAIDVLFANAGIAGLGSAMDIDQKAWNKVIAVNLTGVWLSSKYVLPHMVSKGRGSIINTASIGGLAGFPGIAPYCAAKAGVIGLTRQMVVDYSPKGIRVNAICPGTTPTPLVLETYKGGGGSASIVGKEQSYEDQLKLVAARYPAGRLGTVEEVASLVLFLASDESRWITGAIIPIDGGYTAI